MSVFGDGCANCGKSIYNGTYCSVACAKAKNASRADEKAASRNEDEERLAAGETVRNGLFDSLRIVSGKIVNYRVKLSDG